MLVDYVKSVTGRILTMNNAQPAPVGAERPKAIFDQVLFQHVISDKWNVEDAEKVFTFKMLVLNSKLTFGVPDLKDSEGQWRRRNREIQPEQSAGSRPGYPHNIHYLGFSRVPHYPREAVIGREA